DGSAQLALLCATSDLSGLSTMEVGQEAPVALVAAGHPLGNRATVAFSDLEREPLFQAQCPAAPTDQLLDLVALGRLIMVAGGSTADRTDASIRAIPVSDLPDSTVLLAWPQHALAPAAANMVQLATLLTTGQPPDFAEV